jgi:protein TonB
MEQNNLFVPEWNNPTSDERNELVFEKKNKSYGAFILRKNYTKNILVAFIITAIAVTTFAMIPLTQALLKPKARKFKITAAAITNVEEIPEEKEEEKVEEIAQPKIATQQLTEFAPTEKETVENVNPFDELIAAGIKNQEGKNDPLPEDEYLKGTDPRAKVNHQKFSGFQAVPRYMGKGTVEDYIAANVDPASLEKEGAITVQYVVNAQGKISDVKIVKGLNQQLNDEVLRVVKTLKYKPALQNGNPVPFTVQVPLSFIFGE